MTQYREPDMEVVGLILKQLPAMTAPAALTGHPLSEEDLVKIICHMYENKDFIRKEAGMEAPVASARELEVQTILADMEKFRPFIWNGDRDVQAGLKLVEAVAPFFRKHGVRIKALLKGEA